LNQKENNGIKIKKIKMNPVNGVIVPCITFFDKNLNLNIELNSLLIKHVLINGADSIFIFGNTGEGVYFYKNVIEKRKYLELAFEQTNEDIPVLLGVFGNNIDEVITQLELFAKDYKTLNFIIAPPFSHKLDILQIKEYLDNIIGSVSFKNHIYLYNNPKTFGGNHINSDILKSLLI
jgi:dihydrodipicolinate synthase/N-acetylneuraminate lyase